MTPADRVAARQLRDALAFYRRWLEQRGDSLAPGLASLEAVVSICVTSGQAGSISAGAPVSSDATTVTPRLLTYRTAADVLAVSESMVKRLARTGELPVVHVNGAARIRLADLDAYVDRLAQPEPVST